MRLISIHAKDVQPIRLFEVDNLSDVVVLAGPNGVGKTRLLRWLLQFFQSVPTDPNNWIIIGATCAEEWDAWGQKALDTRQKSDAEKLRVTLQKSRTRVNHTSSVLNFESDRTISQIAPYNFNWDYQDPFLENVGWNVGFDNLRNRFSDTIHSIYRKLRSRKESIAQKMETLIRSKQKGITAAKEKREADLLDELNKDFPDPLTPFYTAFAQLLAPKQLLEPDPKNQQLFFSEAERPFPIIDLSSGEREVVNIVFDFILRNPKDSIVIFDEPELHLHPELSYRLIQTLKSSGDRNQFIFSTHSADIISASLDDSVAFISPYKEAGQNQAMLVREDDETNQALRLLGQSIGIVSLGRKIVLIEGDHGSLDKQTYGSILKGEFPDFVLVPSGGKELIRSFNTLVQKVLDSTLWGIEFFMLCDHDVLASKSEGELQAASRGRLKLLKRYHLENYFLEPTAIAEIFKEIEKDDHWLRDPSKIESRLIEIATKYVSYSTALIVSASFRDSVGSLDIMPKVSQAKSQLEIGDALVAAASAEALRIGKTIDGNAVRALSDSTFVRLTNSLSNGTWKILIPGRPILQTFCSTQYANFDFGRFKTAYIRSAERITPSPFNEIKGIFESFRTFTPTV